MSKREERHRVKLGKMTLAVPVHRDIATTERLAARISETLAEIEEESDRIDTQAFAMLTAYRYAVALDEARAAHKTDNDEMVKALDAVNSRLRSILKHFDDADG